MRATVTVEAAQVIRRVPPLWLGQNMEWVWKGQGLFEEDGSGAKPGVVELIKAMTPGLIRYPGGSLANTFRWANSIGPLAQRRPVTNFFEKTGEVPLLGFDDFMKFTQEVGARGAMITVNCNLWPGKREDSGTAQEAAAWVAYANAKIGAAPVAIGMDARGEDWRDSQYWAKQRAANGHPEPYDVMYWEIGNEVYASEQGAGLTPDTYAARVVEFSRLMKQVDPKIKIGVIDWRSGGWRQVPVKVAAEEGVADFRIVHDYPASGKFLFNYNTGFRDTGDRAYVFTSKAGKHALAVTAWSRPLKGVAAQMRVELDGRVLGVETVKAVSGEKGEVTDTFTYFCDLQAGRHELRLRFLNPDPDEGQPYRDLYLKSIVLQPEGGEAQPIEIQTLELMMVKAAGTAEKLIPDPVPNAKAALGVLPYHRTEYGGMTGGEWDRCCDQKSAILSARMAQASLIDPNCEGANFWCIKSAAFRILESTPEGGFRYAPGGIVFRALAPLSEGEAVMTRYEGPTLMASWVGFPRKRGWVSAVAVKIPACLAVNLLSYHPTRPIAVTVVCNGIDIAPGKARLIAMDGPGPEAMNADGQPPVITMREEWIHAVPDNTTIVLGPCTVATVVFER